MATLPRYPFIVFQFKLQKINPLSTSRSVINFQNTQHPFRQPGRNTNHPNQSECNNLHEQLNTIQKQNLLHHLHTKVPLLISTDGVKGDRRSGGGWIIALVDGIHIVSGYNPNFGQIKAINSYRAEIYASLAAVLFLNMYAEYNIIIIQNKCRSICDNKAYLNKLTCLLEEDFHHHKLYKETENEKLQLILQLIPKQFSIQHVLGWKYPWIKIINQDETKKRNWWYSNEKCETTDQNPRDFIPIRSICQRPIHPP